MIPSCTDCHNVRPPGDTAPTILVIAHRHNGAVGFQAYGMIPCTDGVSHSDAFPQLLSTLFRIAVVPRSSEKHCRMNRINTIQHVFLILSAGQQTFRLFIGTPRKNDLCDHQYSGNNCHHGNGRSNSGFLSLCCCRLFPLPGKDFLPLDFRIPLRLFFLGSFPAMLRQGLTALIPCQAIKLLCKVPISLGILFGLCFFQPGLIVGFLSGETIVLALLRFPVCPLDRCGIGIFQFLYLLRIRLPGFLHPVRQGGKQHLFGSSQIFCHSPCGKLFRTGQQLVVCPPGFLLAVLSLSAGNLRGIIPIKIIEPANIFLAHISRYFVFFRHLPDIFCPFRNGKCLRFHLFIHGKPLEHQCVQGAATLLCQSLS